MMNVCFIASVTFGLFAFVHSNAIPLTFADLLENTEGNNDHKNFFEDQEIHHENRTKRQSILLFDLI